MTGNMKKQEKNQNKNQSVEIDLEVMRGWH